MPGRDSRENLIGATLALFFAFTIAGGVEFAIRSYEEASYRLAPSIHKAYAYGNAYFNAPYGRSYDIGRAERWFEKTLQQDPEHALAHHQLARVFFLRGMYSRALYEINRSIALQSEPLPSSYYVRGLILGYMSRYSTAAEDFERFLAVHPSNWSAQNDYAWVLLKAGRIAEAAAVVKTGLTYTPRSPWLLNTAARACDTLCGEG